MSRKYISIVLIAIVFIIWISSATYSELDLWSNQVFTKSKSTEWINVWTTIFQTSADKLDNSEDYINKSKKQLYDFIAKYRSENNLTSLSINTKLDTAAQKFATYMSNIWVLTHHDNNGNDWSYRIAQEWLPFSYRWEIVSSSVDFSWAIQARKDSKWHREIFNSNKYNNIWVWYYKWMRVIMYYYNKESWNIAKTKATVQTKKLVKVCSMRNYKKTLNKKTKKYIQVKSTCKKYIYK